MEAIEKQNHYHHGHLRRALLDAALELVEERGINGFTMREVARQAKVSHAAPYHHFVDKAALVEALAVESFETLTDVLQAAVATTPGAPVDKILALGWAYVQFALERRAAFRFIFRAELRHSSLDNPGEGEATISAVQQAGQVTYQLLLDSIIACQQADLIERGDPAPLALTAWATVHGLAELMLEKFPIALAGTVSEPQTAQSLTKIVTQTLLRGLLVR